MLKNSFEMMMHSEVVVDLLMWVIIIYYYLGTYLVGTMVQ